MHLPPIIRAVVEAAEVDPMHIGESAASVLRLKTREGVLFLKTCAVADEGGLKDEVDRLQWLEGKLPVPKVVSFANEGGRDFLLMTSVPGVNGVEAGRIDAERVVSGIAQALKMLHATPIDGCPFDQTVTAQIERARRRVAAGLVDETDFDEERTGRTARDVLAELEAWRPSSEALTLTHGDACLPNIMFDGGRFTGFVDCGRFGVADPYQDLALAARSIAYNLGDEHVAALFAQYGLPEPNPLQLAYYRLLDELF
jgi:aminoglycoside 3'-phosphotransferase II